MAKCDNTTAAQHWLLGGSDSVVAAGDARGAPTTVVFFISSLRLYRSMFIIFDLEYIHLSLHHL